MKTYRPVASLLSALALVTACNSRDSSPIYTGSYAFPTAILGVNVSSPTDGQNLRRDLAKFAVRHQLDIYVPGNRNVISDIENPAILASNNTQYAPNPPNAIRGFRLALEELSDGCAIVQFSELSMAWTQDSLHTLFSLMSELQRSHPGAVHLLVRPKREQNWEERQKLRFEDPELPNERILLCERLRSLTQSPR